jgi:type II secretory pathway pseudopilin PulG
MKKRGQVWVETVIYTLIGLAIIGLVMAAALPKINERRDEIVIEQSIEILGEIDEKIYEAVNRGAGNRRVISSLKVGKGALVIDMEEDTISWEIESSFEYSEAGLSIPVGKINVTTVANGPWKVELKLSYNLDLRFDGSDFGTKRIDISPTPYRFIIEHMGEEGGNIVIDLSES